MVTPSMVMETSLTMVLADPPPPDPALPPADCEDDAADAADVDDAAAVDEAADVEDAADDDAAAVDADDVAAALVDAIALMDMKASLEDVLGRNGVACPIVSFNAAVGRSRRAEGVKKSTRQSFSAPGAATKQATRALLLFPTNYSLSLFPSPGTRERPRRRARCG